MSHIVADIQSFAEMNNMELNPDHDKWKDVIVDFLQFNSSVLEPIVIGAIHVETISSFNPLGVYVNNDLTWSVHCEHIIKKSNRQLYALRNPIGNSNRGNPIGNCMRCRHATCLLYHYWSILQWFLPTFLSLLAMISKKFKKEHCP